MQQDIRDVFKNFNAENSTLTKNHCRKFETLLCEELHQKKSKKNHYKKLSVAVAIVLLLTVTVYATLEITNEKFNATAIRLAQKQISLGSVSPEFNTLETYYTNSIHLVMNDLKVTDANGEILAGYLSTMSVLATEYNTLTKELNARGINDNTIDALVQNLQLRLELLQRLKKQLKNLNTPLDENTIL
ncbi:MAG: hypothetical protein ABF284_01195 [Polaribacter sp.]|jgi:hypothetical protein